VPSQDAKARRAGSQLTAAVSNLLSELRGCLEFVIRLSAIFCQECQQLVVPAGETRPLHRQRQR
jgi:hypothetical protein